MKVKLNLKPAPPAILRVSRYGRCSVNLTAIRELNLKEGDCLEVIGSRLVKSGNRLKFAKITAGFEQLAKPGRYLIDTNTLILTPINPKI